MSAQEQEATEPATRKNPFKFLDYYEESDAAIFAGRDEELTKVASSFDIGQTYVLYGRSGLGKTSILKAGVFPRIREQGYLPIYVRLLDDPAGDLCAAVALVLGIEKPAPDELPALLADGVPIEGADDEGIRPVVIALDQFEEFFIRFKQKPELRKSFIELLARIGASAGPAVRFLFSLREDFVAQMNDLSPSLPDILVNSFRLLPLTAFGAREAILVTLHTAGIPFDDVVPGILVQQLEDSNFSPLVLQIYCSEVFNAAIERDPAVFRLRAVDMKTVGSIEDVYQRYLEKVTAGLQGDTAPLLACCILDILRTSDLTKRALRLDDIAIDGTPSGTEAPPPVNFTVTRAEAEEMLTYLRKCRIVRRLPSSEPWYELLHDGIVPVLTEWLQGKESFRRFRDGGRLIANLHTMDSVLSAKQIQQAIDPCRTLLRLTPHETEFVFRSSVLEQAGSVTYWAERYDAASGEGAAARFITEAINHPDQEVAGLVAASRLRLPDGARLCLEKALRHPNPIVRRAGGEALAKFDPDVERQAIRQALRERTTNRRAIELLTELALAGCEVKGFGAVTGWRVRHAVDARKGADFIRNRTTYGMVAGVAAALFWMIAVLAPAEYVGIALRSPQTAIQGEVVGLLLALSLPAVGIGAWLSRRAAKRVALSAIRTGVDSWRPAAFIWEADLAFFLIAWANTSDPIKGLYSNGEWIPHALVPAAVIAAAVTRWLRWRRATDERKRESARSLRGEATALVITAVVYAGSALLGKEPPAVALAATFLGVVVTAQALPLLQRLLRRPFIPTLDIAQAALFGGYAFGLLPLLLTFAIARPLLAALPFHAFRDLLLIAGIAAAIVAVRLPVVAVSLGWAEKTCPFPGAESLDMPEQHAGRRRLLLALRGATAAALAAVPLIFGWHAVPILAKRMTPGDRVTVSSRIWPAILYGKLNESEEWAVVTKRDLGGTTAKITVSGSVDTNANYFILGRLSPLNFAATSKSGSTGMLDFTFDRQSVRRDGDLHDVDLNKGPVLVRLPVFCVNNRVHWVGVLPAGFASGDALMLSMPAAAGEGRFYSIVSYGSDDPDTAGDTVMNLSDSQAFAPAHASLRPAMLDLKNGRWTFDAVVHSTGTQCRAGSKIDVIALIELKRKAANAK